MFDTARFRFYEELNDFLSEEKRKIVFNHQFAKGSSVKDIIESLGVPHTEVDLILINGESVNFSYQVKSGDYVSVYPVFELLDITPLIRLRPVPLRNTRFMLDVHLGKLARYLRLLGFDTRYEKNLDDADIINAAVKERRIILTRDIGLLKQKKVTHGYFLRQTDPKKQIVEILDHFDLVAKCQPFSRCLECNGKLISIKNDNAALHAVPEQVKTFQEKFFQCKDCARIYWQGTHYKKLAAFVEEILTLVH